MVIVRLSRRGAKGRPFYDVVVTDSRKRRDSGFIERIGYFNPIAVGDEKRWHLQSDRLDHWLSHGVKLSDRVQNLIKQAKKATA